MRQLALGALIDATRAATERQRERTRTAAWCRHNATVQRALPPLPESDESELGLLYAIATGESAEGAGRGQADPTHGTGSVAGDGGGHDSQADPGAHQQPATNASGQAASGAPPAQPGSSAGAPAPAGPGDPGNARPFSVPWKLLGWIAAGLTSLGAGGLGWVLGGDEPAPAPMPPPASTTVIERSADQSLYQWLEDEGFHLPPGSEF